MGIPRDRRLRKRADFARVATGGKGRANPLFRFRYAPNSLEVSRYGFSVSRRVGKAVQRNRIKRLLREAVRHLPVQPGFDLVFIARPEVAGTSYPEVRKAVEDLVRRAGLVSTSAHVASGAPREIE